MEKGWNYEYFAYKKKELIERLETSTDFEKREQIKQEIDFCDYLYMTLLFSTGKTFYAPVTMKDFVNDMYEREFSYKIPLEEQENMERCALSFSKLPRLKIEQINTHITVDDSIEIIGDFLKEKFSDEHYHLFKDLFVNNKDYILFDKSSELTFVALLDKETFVKLGKSEDIKMLCSIAHEAGHIYRMVNNNENLLKNSYQEYESFFYEFNLLLWLKENNIYKKEATNHFLHLFNTMEKLLYMRYLIKNYQLNQIQETTLFTEKIKSLHVREDFNLKSDQEFFDTYSTAMNIDLPTYFNSFMAVLNNIDDFDKYEQVVRNIKTGNESEIKEKVLNKNKGEYESYLRYRNFLQDSK